MRIIGRGAIAPPIISPPELPHGSPWSFDRHTKTHTGSGVGFYRDQLVLLRPDQVNAQLLNLITSIFRNLFINFLLTYSFVGTRTSLRHMLRCLSTGEYSRVRGEPLYH